jgi:hypothetical protein
VPDAKPTHLGSVPVAAGRLTRLAYARAKQAGVDLAPLLKSAALEESQVEDAEARLGVRNQIVFLNLVAKQLSDDLLGFHLAQLSDPREIGLLYYVAASSELMGDALRRAARYAKVVNEGIVMDYVEGDDIAIKFRYVGVARDLDRHQIECFMATVVRLCSHLAGRELFPIRVQFTHHRSGDTSEFDALFACRAQFGAATDEIAFPAPIMHLPTVGADPYLNKLLVAQFDEELLRRSPIQKASFRLNVENAIAPLLPHGQAHR